MEQIFTRHIILQQAPKDLDEAYLFKVGKKIPKRLLLKELNNKEKYEYEYVYIPFDSDPFLDKELKCNEWIEIDAFGVPKGFTFKFSHLIHKPKFDEFYFEIIDKSPIQYEEPDCLFHDKIAINQILFEINKPAYDKAQNMLTLLLDRQMCIEDNDEDSITHFEASYYADFYDQVIDLIIKLAPQVWEANKCQVILPSLKE